MHVCMNPDYDSNKLCAVMKEYLQLGSLENRLCDYYLAPDASPVDPNADPPHKWICEEMCNYYADDYDECMPVCMNPYDDASEACDVMNAYLDWGDELDQWCYKTWPEPEPEPEPTEPVKFGSPHG